MEMKWMFSVIDGELSIYAVNKSNKDYDVAFKNKNDCLEVLGEIHKKLISNK